MPDGVYRIDALGVREDAHVDGETIVAPDGAVLVEISVSDGEYAGEWAPGQTEMVLRSGDMEIPADLDDPDDGLAPVVVVPGDGSDADLVLTFEGREAVVSVAAAEVVGDAPFVETLPLTDLVTAATEAPRGWYAFLEAKVQVGVRLVGQPGSLVPTGEGDDDGVSVVCTVSGAGAVADGADSALELSVIEGGGIDGADAVGVVGTVPAGTTVLEVRVDYTLTADGEVQIDRQEGSWTSPRLEPERI